MYTRYRKTKRTLTCVMAIAACLFGQGVACAASEEGAHYERQPMHAEYIGRKSDERLTVFVSNGPADRFGIRALTGNVYSSLMDYCLKNLPSIGQAYSVSDGRARAANYIALVQALKDELVQTIDIEADITLFNTININRSITINAEGRKLNIAPGFIRRHMAVAGRAIELELNGLQFIGGMEGGGITAAGGRANTLRLNNCSFIGNSSRGDMLAGGGAISVASKEDCKDISVMAKGCLFEKNTTLAAGAPAPGGAIMMDAAGSRLEVEECEFRHNSSGSRGGAIAYTAHGAQQLDITASEFKGNVAAEGGAVSIGAFAGTEGGELAANMSGNTIVGNIGDNGIDGGERRGNGGGIFAMAEDGALIMLDINQSNISDNMAYRYGGGIFLQSATGGIECNVDGNTVINANAVDMLEGRGGGVASLANGSGDVRLQLNEAAITSHEASYGGGIYMSGTDGGAAQLLMAAGSRIDDNRAQYGGGVILYSGADMQIGDRASLNGNIARQAGGGIYVFNDSSLTAEGGTMVGNSATSAAKACDKTGGAIYIHSGGSATLQGLALEGNSAGNGGGIYAGGNMDMINCRLNGNKANYGGGAYIDKLTSASITDSVFSNNNAAAIFSGNEMVAGSGGALFTNDDSYANILLSNVDFEDNNAEAGGYYIPEENVPASAMIASGDTTSPFVCALNNFDINYTKGQRATLYTVTIQYYQDNLDGEPMGEISEWVMSGSALNASLDDMFGQGWQNTLRPDGYPNGLVLPQVDSEYEIESDILLKVVYTKTPQEMAEAAAAAPNAAAGQGSAPGEPGNAPQPAPVLSVFVLEGPEPVRQPMAAGYTYEVEPMDSQMEARLLPPSDEVAMLSPAPRPSAEQGRTWSVINLALAAVSLLMGVVMLIKMGVTGKHMDDMLYTYEVGKHSMLYRILTVLASLASVMLFVLTQNTSLPTGLIDKWTYVMAGILIIQLMLIALVYFTMKECRKKAVLPDNTRMFRRNIKPV